ncbi:hypothetical protein HZA99_03265 [Candidatus Woesearchaeota archaeon]|nr:hypothetical protein [Candidatus Woesearchaeota archaeon]
MIFKKGEISLGLAVRLVSILTIALSLPFFVNQTPSTIAVIAYGLGNFLLIVGSQLK